MSTQGVASAAWRSVRTGPALVFLSLLFLLNNSRQQRRELSLLSPHPPRSISSSAPHLPRSLSTVQVRQTRGLDHQGNETLWRPVSMKNKRGVAIACLSE